MLLLSSRAGAAFTQATCPSSNYDTPFPIRLGTIEFDTAIGGGPINYANWQHHQWTLLVNRNVKWVFPRIGPSFETETCCDYLRVFVNGTTATYAGPYAPGYLVPWLAKSDSEVGNYVQLLWHTDYSVTRASQPHFDEVRVMCHPQVQPTTPMPAIPRNTRVEGLLIKTGDVVYTSVYQPPHTKLQVAVDAPPGARTADADFDLYLSTTTTTPDDANHWLRDWTVGASAYLDAGYTTAYGRNVYIGVRSWSGAGQFTLHAYTQSDAYWTSLKLCIPGFDKSTALTDGVRNTLKTGSAWLNQATLGQFLVNEYSVVSIPFCSNEYCSVCDSTCDICMNHPIENADWCGYQSSSLGGTTRIPFYTCPTYGDPVGSGLVLAHELGHTQLYVDDEYYWKPDPDHSRPWCGHTLMNLPYGNSRTLCTSLNHCKDGEDPPPQGCNPNDSGWDLVSFLFSTVPGPGTSADPSRYLAENPSALAAIPVY